MNFLMLRSNSQETRAEVNHATNADAGATLEGLIAEDPFPEGTSSETCNAEKEEFGDENGTTAVSSGKDNSQVDSHMEVKEDDGFIIIPYSTILLLLLNCSCI